MNLPKILVIVGPTASGKTSLALQIAKDIPSEIISTDSRQVYKFLDIGTAKPTKLELAEVPHHCIDIREPDEKFNAGDFQTVGRKAIADILQRKKLPIVCGGTGLYVQAVIDGFFEQPEFTGEVRVTLEERVAAEGKELLYKELQKLDPVSAQTMDATKYRRVIRALEVFYETGVPISQFHAGHKKDQLYNATWIGLNWERSILYKRINDRVDKMISDGFLNEVKRLRSMGYDDRFQALQTVGYKEAFQHIRGEISYERMVELMKQNTRRFAKRQMTWFRKEQRIRWYNITSEDEHNDITRRIIKKFKS